MSTRSLPTRSLAGAAAASAVLMLALASCSSSSDDSDAASGGGSADSVDAAEPAQRDAMAFEEDSDAATNGSAADAGGGVAPADDVRLSRAVIKTGTVELGTDDVGTVVKKIYLLAHSARGVVTSESTSTDDEGVATSSLIELKVPVNRFGVALDEIKSLGITAQVNTDEQDVTGQVADVNSRVRSMEQSIDQLRRLFGQATKLGDVITLERELSRRQADLEALQARQRALHASTTMSTFMVSVDLIDEKAPPKDDEDQAGFVAGIKQGWDGFVTFVIGVSHAVGLILPLGTLALVIGWLTWLLVRRYRTAHSLDGVN